MCINHAVLKRPLAQGVQVKSFNMCPLQLLHNTNTQQLKILEDLFYALPPMRAFSFKLTYQDSI